MLSSKIKNEQNDWINKNKMSKEEINNKYYNSDYLISNGKIMNYNEEVVDLEALKKYD